jgi:hypothetical protein
MNHKHNFTSTEHSLNAQGWQFLPPFVGARLHYLSEVFECDDGIFSYSEIEGRLIEGLWSFDAGSTVTPINFWIAGHDDCQRSIYTGGANWLCADSHYLYFVSIPKELLPDQLEPDNVWVISHEAGVKVLKIIVRPDADSFPDLV